MSKIGYVTTTKLDYEMFNNYIGEIPMSPKALSFNIAKVFGRNLPDFTIYFYGKPDKRLSKLFGYE